MEAPAFADRLATLHYNVDQQPHIVVDGEKCNGCGPHPCLGFCPAGCFTPKEVDGEKTGGIDYYHAGCLECGTCLILCAGEAVRWGYPRGGHGVTYRY